MKILYLSFLMNFYLSYVSSRTLLSDDNELVSLEPKAELHMRLKEKNGDNIIWTKVETKSGRGIPAGQDGNNSGRDEKLIPETSSELLLHQENKDSEDKVIVAKMTETWIENREPLVTEFLFPGSNSTRDTMDFLGNKSQDSDYTNSFEFSDALVIGNLPSSIISELEYDNVSDVVIISFADLNEEAAIAGSLIEIVQPVEQITSNGTFVIEDEDSVLFQEVSTFGFEFLIDSETTKNSLLSELLNSQNISVTDDVNDDLPILLKDWDHSTLENENFDEDQESDFISSINGETLSSKKEIKDFKSEKIINTRDLNFTGSEQNITENISVCPDPGWCFFWLLAEDTCAEDDHCLGPRICCKLGCSKTCIDV